MRSGKSALIWNCGPRGGQGGGGKLTPFHDKRVRQAMTMLLDREKMVRDVWKGIGPVAKGYANPGTLGDDPNMKPLPFDPVRAKALLKEAGWEDRNGDRILEDAEGHEFTFEFTSFGAGETSERIALFVQDSYAAAGTYNVTLTVSNAGGSNASSQQVTTVAPLPDAPTARFSFVVNNLTVQFTDESLGDGITSWLWEFGDGATSTDRNPSHTYAAAGTYRARLTVENPGGSDRQGQDVTVTAPLPAAPVSGFTFSVWKTTQ